jgi:iron complex outermembrane recepter protein
MSATNGAEEAVRTLPGIGAVGAASGGGSISRYGSGRQQAHDGARTTMEGSMMPFCSIGRFTTHARLLYAASAFALAIPGAAHAQDDQASGDQAAEGADAVNDRDIIVTAQFREQRLQDTPIAITAISGEAIENKGLNSVVDIAAEAPNVTMSQGGAAFSGAAVFIRGIGQYDSNFALEPGVGVYIDDIYHGVMVGSMFDLLDLDRVEILRGPQGTLAGKNSIGGAIKMFSRKPQGDGSGYISATYGSYDRIELRAAYDIGLSENIFLRVSGFTKHRDGHVKILDHRCDRPNDALPTDPPTQVNSDDCQIGTLGGIKSSGLRAALRIVPSSDLEINLFGSIIRDDSEPAGIEQTASTSPRFLPNRDYVFYGTYTSVTGWSIEPEAKTHSESVGGQIDWDISDSLRLTSITSYENINSEWAQDLDGTPLGDFLTYNRTPYHQFTQELRLNGEVGDGLVEWTVGGFYFDSKGYVGARTYSFPALNWIQDDPVTNESKSAFAHVVVHPVPNMSLIGGIRYTDDQKAYQFSRINPDTGLPADIVGVLDGFVGEYSGDSWDYRLGADYRFSDQLMVYANFSTGYKGGGINPRPFIPPQAVPFNPERVTAYELGFKSDFADGAVRFNAAAFLNKYRGIILIDTNGYPGGPADPGWFPLSAVPFNGGDADIKGLEFETVLEPIPGLNLSGSLSYLDFEYTELDPNASASGVTLDSKSPFSPEWKWSAQISYEIPLGNAGSITPAFYADYTDSFYADSVNAPSNFIESRTLLNANITYRTADEDWEIIVGATNLTDKHYYTAVFDISQINGTTSNVVARPREFYLSVRRNF